MDAHQYWQEEMAALLSCPLKPDERERRGLARVVTPTLNFYLRRLFFLGCFVLTRSVLLVLFFFFFFNFIYPVPAIIQPLWFPVWYYHFPSPTWMGVNRLLLWFSSREDHIGSFLLCSHALKHKGEFLMGFLTWYRVGETRGDWVEESKVVCEQTWRQIS